MPKRMCVGIDPGTVNMGIASVIPSLNIVELFQVKKIRLPNPVDRIKEHLQFMDFCINYQEYYCNVIIEGASYADKYRQVELEQIRTSSVIWSFNHKFDVYVVPPNTIRKELFGKATIKAHNVWTNLDPDVAAALSCALFPVL